MLLKLSTVFALVATLASLHQSEAATKINTKISYPGILTISPDYQTKNPSDTFAQACASNTFQLSITTTALNRKTIAVCNIDLTKLNVEQYCALTNANEFFGLQCGTAVVKVQEDATGTKQIYTSVEADFTGSIFPPKVTNCARVKVAGGSKKLAKRWVVLKTIALDPFACPKA